MDGRIEARDVNLPGFIRIAANTRRPKRTLSICCEFFRKLRKATSLPANSARGRFPEHPRQRARKKAPGTISKGC